MDVSGRADAWRLSAVLAGLGVERIVTSPYRRCVQTVEFLAARAGVDVEVAEELAPDAAKEHVARLLDQLRDSRALACTHREVFETLFGGEVTCEKGAGWLLERGPRGWRAESYIPAPTSGFPGAREATLVRS